MQLFIATLEGFIHSMAHFSAPFSSYVGYLEFTRIIEVINHLLIVAIIQVKSDTPGSRGF